MRKFLPLLIMLFFCTVGNSQPVIDGMANDAQYVTLSSWQGSNNWAPTNQLGAIKYFCNGTKIYIGITGKLEQNWNKLMLVINFGGYNGIPVDNPNELRSGFNSFFQGLAGTQLGIETDYILTWTYNNSPLYCDGQRYGPSSAIQGAYLGSSDYLGNLTVFNENDVKSALGGSTGGFTQAYRQDFDRTTNPDAGLEFAVDITAFAGIAISQSVSFFVTFVNSDGTWISNQTLPDHYATGLFNNDFGYHPNISYKAWDARTNYGFSNVYFFTEPIQPLPVELVSFSAETVNNVVKLNWQTKTELNNHGWDIQRCTETGVWTTLHFVAGQGNSNSSQDYVYLDKSVNESGTYKYRLKQIDNDGSFEYSQERKVEVSIQPSGFDLHQNFPNPFNPATEIKFDIPVESKVEITLFNAIGQKVKSLHLGVLGAGSQKYKIDIRDLPSGVYYYNLKAIPINGGQAFQATKKMSLVR